MAIDSFWWILALISDQTVYEALNQNVFIFVDINADLNL